MTDEYEDISLANINEFEEILNSLDEKKIPFDYYDDFATNNYLFYPSAESVKCVVVFDKVTHELSIIGENFISSKCCEILPIEKGLQSFEIADRIEEDTYEEYPINENLTKRVQNFIASNTILSD